MKIKTHKDLFELVCKKIIKYRKRAIERMKKEFPCWVRKEDFKPFEIERTEITLDSILPQKAYNSLVSLDKLKKLNGKDVRKLERQYKEGETTVGDFIGFFFPRKKKKNKKKERH